MTERYKSVLTTITKLTTMLVVLLITGSAAEARQLTAFNTLKENQRNFVTVNFADEPLANALLKLTRQAKVGISYDTKVLPKKDITYQATNEPVYRVLNDLLEGTDLYLTLSNNRKVIIIKELPVLPLYEFPVGKLRGSVVDASTNELMPGANVFISETGQGTSTDKDGKFEIVGIQPGVYEVLVSFIGYEQFAQEVEIFDGETTRVEFKLTPSSQELESLVVTGYGIRQRAPTGAISTVSGEDFKHRSIQTPDQALQGRAAGFRMINTSGQPGGDSYIRIRGIGSINASTSPLFIVDGIRLESSYRGTQGSNNILQGLNPSDIESINVLKDAEATALYGAEGSNGVVLISTRGGKEGPTQISASAQLGVSEQMFKYDMMNGPDFVNAMAEAYANRYEDLGKTTYKGTTYSNPREAGTQAAYIIYGHPDDVGTYDWYGAFLRPGIQQRYNLSARGGSESTQFYISAGLNDQEGTIIGNKFERVNLRTNLTHRVSEKLLFDVKTNISRSKATGLADSDGSTSGSNWIGSPFHGGVTTRVTSPIYNPDGSYNQDPSDLSGVMYNNVQVLNEEERFSRTFQLLGNASATYKFTENLSIRSRWAMDFRTVLDHRFYNPSINRYNAYGGAVYERTREVTSWNTDQVLDYVNTYRNVHNVNVILGAEYQHMYRRYQTSHGRGLPSELFETISSTAENYSIAGSFAEYKNAGIFSRAEYDFDKKYFATVNLRYDGSSRFGKDKRFGLFYSGSLAWDIAAEPFMNDVDFIFQLKPRISHGTSGNSGIGYYAARPFFGTGGSYGGETGLRPTQLGNATLTWEKAVSTDIGVDWAVMEGRVYGSFAVFRKDNKDLLLERNLPTNSGFSNINDNVGTVRVEGVEIELGATILRSGKFHWNTDFNLTYERSEILKLVGDQESIGNTIRVGQPRQIRWGAKFAGVNPSNGQPMWYDENNNLTYSVKDADRRPIGSQLPDFYGGLQNQFNYGPFSLSMLFHYEYGKDIRNYQHDVFMMAPHRGRTLSTDMNARWQKPGDMTEVPRMYSSSSFPGGSSVTTFDTKGMQDGSFIRLKNVTLQYDFTPKLLNQIGIKALSIFVQGENLLTWTAFTGPDPEIIAQSQTHYPQPRTFMGGFNLDF